MFGVGSKLYATPISVSKLDRRVDNAANIFDPAAGVFQADVHHAVFRQWFVDKQGQTEPVKIVYMASDPTEPAFYANNGDQFVTAVSIHCASVCVSKLRHSLILVHNPHIRRDSSHTVFTNCALPPYKSGTPLSIGIRCLTNTDSQERLKIVGDERSGARDASSLSSEI